MVPTNYIVASEKDKDDWNGKELRNRQARPEPNVKQDSRTDNTEVEEDEMP